MTEDQQANSSSAVLSGETCQDCTHLRLLHNGPACVAHVIITASMLFGQMTTSTYNAPRSIPGGDTNRYGCSHWLKGRGGEES